MSSFEQRIAERFSSVSPSEQRVLQFFQRNREEVMIASAADLAAKIATSDATVLRAVKGLGYSGLDALRRALASELKETLSPAERLHRTLKATEHAPGAFEGTLSIHLECLENMRRNLMPRQFEEAVEAIVSARRVATFGIGPTSAIASYLTIQLNRFGVDAFSMTHTGLLFADDLRKLRMDDVVVIFAYGRVYDELAALIDTAENLRLRTCLITDSLASALHRRINLIISVPRGRFDHFSTHSVTLTFVEALLVGVAEKRPQETLASLRRLNEDRVKLAGKTTRL